MNLNCFPSSVSAQLTDQQELEMFTVHTRPQALPLGDLFQEPYRVPATADRVYPVSISPAHAHGKG